VRTFSRLLCLALLGAAATPVLSGGRGEPGPYVPVEIRLVDREADLKLLLDLDIDVDGVFFDRVRAYVIPEEMEKLTLVGFDVEPIPDEAKLGAAASAAELIPPAYHTYASLTSELQAIATARPDLTRLVSAGTSVQGRELWMMKITRNPGIEEDEPEVRYIAAIHGDEVVGKELCIELIHYLVDNYGIDPRVTALVDSTEIWILPSMNPDGTELTQRYNVNGYDLNRNFPDQFTDPNDTPAGRQPEVAAVMNWGYAHATNLSANFHGGTLVVNYPYDGTASGVSDYSAGPDDGWFVSISRTYADRNPPMFQSNSDPAYFNGITNGADWYVVRGGMQDWNYVYRGDHEVTIELGTKWPAASTLPTYWSDNLDSMLSYFERVHEGVRGIVTDAVSGAPLAATIRVAGSTIATYTDPDVGDYHRLLLPGVYRLEISAAAHVTAVVDNVVVEPGAAVTRQDVALLPLQVNLQVANSFVLDTTTGNGNGVLDPGELSDLALSLRDLGASAYTVSGWLEPIGPFATVPRASATYPNIPANQSRTSNSPHYAVSVSALAPVGHKLGFAVHWTAAGASGVSEAVYLPVSPRTCVTVNSSDVPRSVQDRATSTSTLHFPTDLEVEEVNVYVNVTHPYIGDLAITAISPAQTPVLLHNHSGGSADDVVGWYDTGKASFDPLERFRGEHSAGTWTLKVADGVPANTGTLNAWSVEGCGRPFEASPPEMKFRGFSKDSAGNVVLDWWGYPGLSSYRVYRAAVPTSAAAFSDVTSEDPDPTDTRFVDSSTGRMAFWLVTGVGPGGEGPWGHFGR